MKKSEALQIVPQRVKVIIEYITSILEDDKKVYGKIEFNSTKINNENMCTMDIYVPESNFERHINLGITTNHCDILYKLLFDEFINQFLEHKYLGVTRHYTMQSIIGPNFDGVNAVNGITGSEIKINFLLFGPETYAITTNYNKRLDYYIEQQKNNTLSNKHINRK